MTAIAKPIEVTEMTYPQGIESAPEIRVVEWSSKNKFLWALRKQTPVDGKVIYDLSKTNASEFWVSGVKHTIEIKEVNELQPK